jgi:hypothetical protein
MKPEILNYIESQRVGVLAVEMLDGSPHAATVHYAHTSEGEKPLVLYFETNKEYRKTEALTGRPSSRASFVIGTSEETKITFQLDGVVELIQPDEMQQFEAVYLGKFPEKQKKVADGKLVFFKFTPTWWRFSDFSHPEIKNILTSTDTGAN